MNHSKTKNNDSGSGPLKWLLAPLALVTVPFYKLGKALSAEAYRGFARGLFNGLIGLVLATLAAYGTAGYLGWAQSLTLFIWFPSMCLAWLATLFIAWPATFLYFVKPIHDLLEKFFKWSDRLAKEVGKPFFNGVVDLHQRFLPGSAFLWRLVDGVSLDTDNDENTRSYKRESWVHNLVGFLAVLGLLSAGGWAGYSLFQTVLPLVPGALVYGYAAPALALLAGSLAFLLVSVPLYQLTNHGELRFIVVVLGAIAAWSSAGSISGFLESHVLHPLLLVPASALTFIAFVGYAYPGVHAALSSNLIKQLLEKAKELAENTYDDQDETYRKYFGHLASAGLSLAAASVALWGLSLYGIFPVGIVAAGAVFTALVSYLYLGDILKRGAGAVVSGLVATAALSIYLYTAVLAGASLYMLGAAFIGTVVLGMGLLFPIVYHALRYPTRSWLAGPAGTLMESTHEKARNLAEKATRFWEKRVIARTYEDKSDYRDFFMHLFNLGLLGLGAWQAAPLASGWLGLGPWATIGLLAILAYLVYMVLGKVLLSMGPVGAGLAMASAIFLHSTYELFNKLPSHWPLAVIIGGAAASIAFFVVIPALLLVIRVPLSVLVMPWLRPVIVGLYDFLWARFDSIWTAFLSVATFFWNKLFAPIVNFLASLFSWVIKTVSEVWESIFGKKS